MKLSEWAKKNSLTYRAAYNHFKKGMIKGAYQLSTNHIVIPEESLPQKDYHVVYARVSSSENKENLNSQSERIVNFCIAKGWTVQEVIKECASGLNDNRPKLSKILKDRKATKLIVEHKDRLTRFGFNYIQFLYPECEIVIINEAENDQDDLMQDFINLVTSFCARLYGKRRSKRSTEKLIEQLKNND
jgi:putative resolvase